MSKKETEKLVLVSPAGHKYEIAVSDAGNLTVTLASEKDEKEA